MVELNKVNELINTLKPLIPMKQEYQTKLDKKFRLEFNYNTNHLEGNTLTYSETELLLIFDDTKGGHTLRELEEMKGGDVAFQFVQQLASDKERPLTEQNIKSLNEILLVRPFWKDATTSDGQSTRRQIKVGDYKEHPNSVRLQNGEIFDYASPLDTPILMKELIDWYRTEEENGELHPIVLAALFHYKFVRIHPFDDGNGRLSRLLMNYVLFRNDLPPIVIKSEDKPNYLKALNKADTGDIDSFVNYIIQQLMWSLELSIKAAKGESIDEPGDLDKKIKLLKQKLNSSTEEVKIKKNKEAVYETFTSNIEPLIIEVSEKLSEFDSLFRSKTESLKINFSSDPIEGLKAGIIHTKNVLKTQAINTLAYKFDLLAFRKGPKPNNFSCGFTITFFQNVYEFHSENINSNFSKLYHERIEREEMNLIVEELGTYILEQIEKSIDLNS